MDQLIVFGGCLIGGTLNIICGAGVGVFCMMFLPYVMQSTSAPAALINIVTFYQAAWVLWKYWRRVEWKRLLTPLLGYFAASLLAVRLTRNVDFQVMKRVLGVLFIGLSAYFLFFSDRLRLRPTPGNGFAAGAVSGVLSGLFAVGGPPAAMYFSAINEDKDAYLADLQGFYFASGVYIIAVRAVSGIITKQLLLYAVWGIAGMALGSILGNRVFQRANDRSIAKAMYAMMAVSGLTLLFA